MKDRIFLKGRIYYERIFINDIIWIKGAGSSVDVHTSTARILVSMNLKTFLNRLNSPFIIRAHRSYAVNLDFVKSVNHKSLALHIIEGKEQRIPVSGTYKDDLYSKLRFL